MRTIKKLGLVLIGFLAQGLTAQVVIPHNIPCLDITPENIDSLESGIRSIDCIRADGETIDFNTDQNYSIRAGEYITFNENTVIEPDSSHTFHAYIQREDMDLSWYHPNDIAGEVGRYEKLEIGVQFSDSTINAKINNFVNNQVGDKLNPFDPEQVDLYANFWVYYALPDSTPSWYGPKRVNGFYYQEYTRGYDTYDTLETEDNFRIRYAPTNIGTWLCQVTAVVDGYDTMHVSDFTFECVASDNKGFVNVGENKHYLRVGTEPFFPVGQNLTGPNRTALTVEWDSVPAKPYLYTQFHGQMTELADNGANYFRYIVSPWQSEIEFEHLGNYSNRMTNAWEFDKILDTAKALDLKMHYNMQMHYAFEAPSGHAMTNWDWSAKGDSLNPSTGSHSPCWLDSDSGYCYRKELGILDPLDFLTDTIAMKYYKKRLRYMVARWGYSTEIGVMELLSEANNFGATSIVERLPKDGGGWGCYGSRPDPDDKTRHPYREMPALICSQISDWQIEMCRYIKEDLGHYEHPLAVDYTGILTSTPDPQNVPRTDYSDYAFYSNKVDIANYNYYALAVNKAEINYNNIHKLRTVPSDGPHSVLVDKPIMNPEYGTSAQTFRCDHNSGFIHRVCLTPFTGAAGSAMTWDQHFNELDAWQYLGPVKDFMEGVPLDEGNWRAKEPLVMDDKSMEILYLRNSSGHGDTKIIGAISNRTFNYYTAGDDTLGCSFNIPTEDKYKYAENYTSSDLGSEMKFTDLGPNNDFQVDFYNAITGSFVGTTYQSSNVLGNLVLNFPGTLTGDSLSPILFFKFYPDGESFLAPIKPEETADRLPVNFNPNPVQPQVSLTPWPKDFGTKKSELSLAISPNPTTDVVWCKVQGDYSKAQWSISNSHGQLLNQGNISSENFTIDLLGYANDIYYVTLSDFNGEVIQTIKLIKQ